MKILMFNNEYPPLGGGMGTVNQALIDRFSGRGNFEIDLITSGIGSSASQEVVGENIRIFRVPIKNRNIHHSTNSELIRYAIRALHLAKSLHRKAPYDFSFAWSAVPAGGCAYLLKEIFGVPYIVRVCGPDIPGFESRYNYLYPFLTPIIKMVWRNAETVVAKCDLESRLIRAIEPAVSLTIIQNGVDVHTFRSDPRKTFGNPLQLLCVGRLIERKGQRDLFRAMEILKSQGFEFQLTLVGTGDSLESYKSEVDIIGLGDFVQFAGYVPRDKIKKYYHTADIFVLPSYNEGMSVATLEAMASGLPLVVTNTGGTEDLVEVGLNGYIYEPGDIKSLIKILKKLYKNQNELLTLGEESRRKAEMFTWTRAANHYSVLFNFMLSKDMGVKRAQKIFLEN